MRYAGGAQTANMVKAMGGGEPGTPDLLILEPGIEGSHGFAAEFKIGKDTLKDAQVQWFVRAQQKGWRCAVVRTADEFRALVRQHSDGGAGSSGDPCVVEE